MAVAKRVPEEQYFINTICVTARCVFVWLSPGTAAQGGNGTAPSSAGTALGAARGWLLGLGSALGQGAQAGPAGVAKQSWLGWGGGCTIHHGRWICHLPSAALMGSAGSEQSKAKQMRWEIKLKAEGNHSPGLGETPSCLLPGWITHPKAPQTPAAAFAGCCLHSCLHPRLHPCLAGEENARCSPEPEWDVTTSDLSLGAPNSLRETFDPSRPMSTKYFPSAPLALKGEEGFCKAQIF